MLCGTFVRMDLPSSGDQSKLSERATAPDASTRPPVLRPRLSRLAVASFSLSIVGCCAIPAAAAAVMLGFIASERIRRSDGVMRGKNFAVSGIVLGCFGIVTSLALQNFAFSTLDEYESQMSEGVAALLREGSATAEPQALETRANALFEVGAAGVDASARRAFADAVRARYGALESTSVVSSEPIGSVFEPSFHWEVVFRFDGGKSVSGSVRTKLVPEIGSMMPTSRLTKVRIDGGEEQSLQLPAADATEPAKNEPPESSDSGSSSS